MEITTDAILRGPIWAETLDRLKGTVFETYWDAYALCIAIGMMFDEQIESNEMVPDGYELEARSVPRNVLIHANNSALLSFMFQSALITTKHINLGEDERLELAFNETKQPDFNPIAFLTKFANFGATKLHEIVIDTTDVELLENMITFLNSTYEDIDKHILESDLEELE